MIDKYLSQIMQINEKIDLDTEFPDWNKSVQFVVTDFDGGEFYFTTNKGKVAKVEQGKLANPDVTIEGTSIAMSDLFDGNVSIVGAFITKQVTIKGAIGDALGAKVLLDAVRVY
jgi:putative sterol carrier protein